MQPPTFIAILDFTVPAADRPTALAHLRGERPSIRAMPGNIAFRVFSSQENATDLTVLHEWSDQAAFEGYLTSESFARSGAALRPMMSGAPTSRRFQVQLVETVT